MVKHAGRRGDLMLAKTITTAILIGTLFALTITMAGAILPLQVQAQNATGTRNTTTGTTGLANNNKNTTVVGANSSTLAAGQVNVTGVDTFTASGYIAGLILPMASTNGQMGNSSSSNMTSMASSNATSGGNATLSPTTSTNSAATTNATTLSSVVPAKAFILSGAWHIRVENGKILFLDIKFTKVHLDASNRHVHEITNFRPVATASNNNNTGSNNSTSIRLNANGTTTITGTTDVSLNRAVTWTNVKTVIVIDKLSTITIMLDPKETSNHFLGQSIYGTVNMLKDGKGNNIITFPRP
jgi:hypothetical protein